MVTTVNKNRKGYRANCRGDLESVLNCCTHIIINGIEREIYSQDIMKIQLANLEFSKEGLLTEAFAYRSFNYQPSEHENIESNLVFVGLIALENPLIDGDEFIEAEIASKAPYIQPHIASYVTSLARIVLYKGLLEQQEKGAVAYCDTDSIACQSPMLDEMIDDKEYGKWKLESEIVEGIFLQPKTYWEKHAELIEDDKGQLIHKETKKFKGIPSRKMDNVNEETYRTIFGKLQDIQKRVADGENISKDEAYFPLYTEPEKKRFKFAMNLKNGKTNFDEHYEITKGIVLTNMQKRDMDYINNTSKPHKLIDFIEGVY